MRNIMVLTEDTSQIASAKEDRAGSVVSLKTRLFSEVGSYRTNFHRLGSDQAMTRRFISIDVAQARAQIALPKMRICCCPLLCGVDGRDQVVARYVVIQEERRGKVKGARTHDSRGIRGARFEEARPREGSGSRLDDSEHGAKPEASYPSSKSRTSLDCFSTLDNNVNKARGLKLTDLL